MKIKNKGLIIIILSLVICFSQICFTVLANDSNNTKGNETTQNGEDSKGENGKDSEFLLGSWLSYYDYSFKSYEEQTKDLADFGINFLFFPYSLYYKDVDNPQNAADWEKIDEVLTQNNIKYLISAELNGNTDFAFNRNINYANSITSKNKDTTLIGYHLKDEPVYSAMEDLGGWVKKYLAETPNLNPFVNLFPSYVGSAGLGGHTFKEYCQQWVDCVGKDKLEYLSYDFYPFGKNGVTNTNMFSDLEAMRSVAYENGKLNTHGFIQSQEWGDGMKMPTRDEIAWSIYAHLAYGFKAVSYFNYAGGFVSIEGNKDHRTFIRPGNNATYASAEDKVHDSEDFFNVMTTLNKEVKNVGNELMKYDVSHAYHTQTKYKGVEYLPDAYLITPTKKADDYVISYLEAKDGSNPCIMILNNSWTNANSTSFIIDEFSGMDGIEYFNPKTCQYEDINISSGSLSLRFDAGEGKLFRLKGKISIAEKLKDPAFSLKSGTYNGIQSLEINKGDSRDQIYYTLDGSYPSTGAILYDGSIQLGEIGKTSYYKFRAIAIRGRSLSKLIEADYTILNTSENIALNKRTWLSLSATPYSGSKVYGPEIITDGKNDLAITSIENKACWMYLDLGKESYINKIVLDSFENDKVKNIVVQGCNNPYFNKDVITIFQNDETNSTGFGGTSNPHSGVMNANGEITFDTKNVRYLRVTNNINGKSVFAEIEVYNDIEAVKTKINENKTQWENISGNWENNEEISLTLEKENSIYFYNSNKYKNFILLADIKSPAIEEDGYIGFDILKENKNTDGIKIGVTKNGNAVFKNGNITNKSINYYQDFDSTKYNQIKIIKAYETISLYVNDVLVEKFIDQSMNEMVGYVGLYSTRSIMQAKNITIEEINTQYDKSKTTITSIEFIEKIMVQNKSYRSVLSSLPKQVTYTDSNENSGKLKVVWSCDNYDCMFPGNYFFEGQLVIEDLELTNVFNLTAQIVVYVMEPIDYSGIETQMARFEELDGSEFTPETWKQAQIYYDNAVAMYNDNTLNMNAIGVGANQLEIALKNLVRANVDKTELSALVKECKQINYRKYTVESYKALKHYLDKAENLVSDTFSSQDDVDDVKLRLEKAKDLLVEYGQNDKLIESIKKAEAIDKGNYTDRSFSNLQNAISYAKIISQITTKTQCEYDAVSEFLLARINALVIKE